MGNAIATETLECVYTEIIGFGGLGGMLAGGITVSASVGF